MTPTADICDGYGDEVKVLDGSFASYGGATSFSGPISTLAVFEDNSKVRDALEEPGAGRVLVIAGGGSTRCALVGGNIGQLADDNGWAGILVDGCVRDVGELRGTTIGIRARGTSPRRSVKSDAGERDVRVTVGGVEVSPGMWLWADDDGIVVADRNLEE
jgi:regulator of ribonuclease activity A